MSAPLFDKDWLEVSDKVHDAAYSKFQAAVTSAMSGSDENIKVVSTLFVY
jgi:hypothetical protein